MARNAPVSFGDMEESGTTMRSSGARRASSLPSRSKTRLACGGRWSWSASTGGHPRATATTPMAFSANDAAAHHAAMRTPFGGVRGQTILPGTTGRGLFLPKSMLSQASAERAEFTRQIEAARGTRLGEALECAHAYARGAEPAASPPGLRSARLRRRPGRGPPAGGGRVGKGRGGLVRAGDGHPTSHRTRIRSEPESAALAHARPIRPSNRRSRFSSGVARADAAFGRERRPLRTVARPGRRSARRTRGEDVPRLADGSRPRVPGVDDVLRLPGPAAPGRPARGMGAADRLARIRLPRAARGRKARRPDRHGHDREAGRLRRAGEHHAGRPARRRRLRAHGTQVVLLGADERRVPGAGASAAGALLLPPSPLDARRRAQRLPSPAAQGQAREPEQRLRRSGARRCLGAPPGDRKSTRLNSSHVEISYAVFCLKKKKKVSARSLAAHTKYKKNKEA